jgi:neutral ceramidase
MKAGASQRDITPPIGFTIDAPTRTSQGVNDPIFIRALVLEDEAGTSVAIVTCDLIGCGFEAFDQVQRAVREATGIEHLLLNFAHQHSTRWLTPKGARAELSDDEFAWQEALHEAIVGVVAEAKSEKVPATLRAGRAPVQVGFNRRIVLEGGQIHMGDNKDGNVVPWVNVLGVEHAGGGELLAVLFEHAAHPVIVPDSSNLTSADFPGAAVAHVKEMLGPDVVAMFAQGCGANINAYPLRSSHENADLAGEKLGDAVVAALAGSSPIAATTFRVRSGRIDLPCQPYPDMAMWQATLDLLEDDWRRGTESGKPVEWITEDVYRDMLAGLDVLKGCIARGQTPAPHQFGATVVGLGTEWALVSLAGEIFCEYELRVDAESPFDRTMTFGYTNGIGGYIADDASLAMGAKGGYEAGSYPCWWASGVVGAGSPLAVGTEERICDLVRSLWTD